MWLCTETEANDVNHGVGIVQFPTEHFLDDVVVRREVRLVLREAAFHLDLGLHRIAKRAEFMGDAAEEDSRAGFHGDGARMACDGRAVLHLSPGAIEIRSWYREDCFVALRGSSQ